MRHPIVIVLWAALSAAALAQSPTPAETLFRNVRVFDGKSTSTSAPTDVLVRGDRIAAVGPGAATPLQATVIDGTGRTLTPGLIDAHTHIMMAELPATALLTADIGYVTCLPAAWPRRCSIRLHVIRDAGGPAFGLKRAIDAGVASGPRIWVAGAIVSQTVGPRRLPLSGRGARGAGLAWLHRPAGIHRRCGQPGSRAPACARAASAG